MYSASVNGCGLVTVTRRLLNEMFRTTPGGLELWVTNSGRVPIELDVTVEVGAFGAAALLQEKLAVRAEAGSSQVVWSTGQKPSADQYAWVSSPDPRLEPNRACLGKWAGAPATSADGVVAAIAVPSFVVALYALLVFAVGRVSTAKL